MSRGPSRQTRLVIEIIEDELNHAAGDLTPKLDDLAIEFRQRLGGRMRTRDAERCVARSLDPALRLLEEDGWFGTKVTEYYVEHYAQTPSVHPPTDVEIIRCVAGAGTSLPTYAVHFCTTDNCVLWIETAIRNGRSGERKVARSIERMTGRAESGLLTPDAIARIAAQAGLSPRKDLNRAARVAAKSQQRLLPLN